MVRKISEIYAEYKIMPNLQMHMYRVAAVASLIYDNFNEPLNKEEIITACLLHDMGNIIKSDLSFLPELLKPEGLEYWQKVKDGFIEKYGNDDHEAHVKILKELGLSTEIIGLVDQVRFSLLCAQRDKADINIKITHYADGRVDPYGIVSYEERMEEAKSRYKDRDNLFPLKNREKLIECGKDMERQIFAKCKIRPEDINNETVAPIISSLRNFVIK